MPRIPNLADLDIESEHLEQLQLRNPDAWAALAQAGYQVAMPNLLGRSGGEDVSWFMEVDAAQTVAWIWSHRDEVYLGPKYLVSGDPAQAVVTARKLLEDAAQQEALSGVDARSTSPATVQVGAGATVPAA
ncbi:hypothetical protein D3C71_20010 [compost metagenome]